MNDFSLLGCFPLLGNDAPSRALAEFMVSAFAEAMMSRCKGVDPKKTPTLGRSMLRKGHKPLLSLEMFVAHTQDLMSFPHGIKTLPI